MRVLTAHCLETAMKPTRAATGGDAAASIIIAVLRVGAGARLRTMRRRLLAALMHMLLPLCEPSSGSTLATDPSCPQGV